MQYSEDDFYKLVGEKIRLARQASGMSQADLASKIGMRRTSITNIESGQQNIQAYQLCLISEELNISILNLLPLTDSHETDVPQLLTGLKVITSKGKKEDLTALDLKNIRKVTG